MLAHPQFNCMHMQYIHNGRASIKTAAVYRGEGLGKDNAAVPLLHRLLLGLILFVLQCVIADGRTRRHLFGIFQRGCSNHMHAGIFSTWR
jgi:hypothetical protein